MIRNLRDLIGIARRAFSWSPRDYTGWSHGEHLTADAWPTYQGWRWQVLDDGELVGYGRSAGRIGAEWAATRVMRRHVEAGAA